MYFQTAEGRTAVLYPVTRWLTAEVGIPGNRETNLEPVDCMAGFGLRHGHGLCDGFRLRDGLGLGDSLTLLLAYSQYRRCNCEDGSCSIEG